MQGGSERRGRVSPFADFMALVELLAGRHSNQNQGLTKDEIKDLKKI